MSKNICSSSTAEKFINFCTAESLWVPNKSSGASINVFLIIFSLCFQKCWIQYSAKIAYGFSAPEEQEKVITASYALVLFVSYAKILNHSVM